MIEFLTICFCVAVLAGVAFWLGYDTARSRFDVILKGVGEQVKLAAAQRHALHDFIKKNWPTEHAAYHAGWRDGYERGLNEGPILREDHQ